jgi:hypothetical protein
VLTRVGLRGFAGRCGGGGGGEEEDGLLKATAMNQEEVVFVLAHLPVPYIRMIWETGRHELLCSIVSVLVECSVKLMYSTCAST